MVTFLGDVLRIYKRLQKRLQSNSLHLIRMSDDIEMTITSLEKLKVEQIPGGYENLLRNTVIYNEEDEPSLKSILLNRDNLFRSVDSIQNFRFRIIESLQLS